MRAQRLSATRVLIFSLFSDHRSVLSLRIATATVTHDRHPREHARAHGFKALCGRWLIQGAPNVLLFDTGSQYDRLDQWYFAGISSPPSDHIRTRLSICLAAAHCGSHDVD
ncbi:hypothetical protein BDZ89DRAFT_694101 [Hymenopellis radicata]|nr:hypothetical protein BDZ89DRAFT_694101 [Hymenopellis radicata]